MRRSPSPPVRSGPPSDLSSTGARRQNCKRRNVWRQRRSTKPGQTSAGKGGYSGGAEPRSPSRIPQDRLRRRLSGFVAPDRVPVHIHLRRFVSAPACAGRMGASTKSCKTRAGRLCLRGRWNGHPLSHRLGCSLLEGVARQDRPGGYPHLLPVAAFRRLRRCAPGPVLAFETRSKRAAVGQLP